MNNSIPKKIVAVLVTTFFVVVPSLVLGQEDRIVPDCGDSCGYEDFITLVSNLIRFIFFIAVMVATLMVAWTGISLIISQGNPSARTAAKRRLWSVVKGIFWMMAAFFLVGIILNSLVVNCSIGEALQNTLQVTIENCSGSGPSGNST